MQTNEQLELTIRGHPLA